VGLDGRPLWRTPRTCAPEERGPTNCRTIREARGDRPDDELRDVAEGRAGAAEDDETILVEEARAAHLIVVVATEILGADYLSAPGIEEGHERVAAAACRRSLVEVGAIPSCSVRRKVDTVGVSSDEEPVATAVDGDGFVRAAQAPGMSGPGVALTTVARLCAGRVEPVVSGAPEPRLPKHPAFGSQRHHEGVFGDHAVVAILVATASDVEDPSGPGHRGFRAIGAQGLPEEASARDGRARICATLAPSHAEGPEGARNEREGEHESSEDR
jgi:hypothetical protein